MVEYTRIMATDSKRILIASALFPPDIADPAPYIKEQVKRLSEAHTVTILTYGNIPESVAGAQCKTVPKRLPALVRIIQYTAALFRNAAQADVILVHNAPSTELPLLILGLVYRNKAYLQYSDQKIVYSGWRRILHICARKMVCKYVTLPLPPSRPEILPFSSFPHDEQAAYEEKWNKHCAQLTKYLV